MNPIFQAVSKLLDSGAGVPVELSSAEIADSLSRETRIRVATRLALVRLAARCEQGEVGSVEDAHPCELCAPLIARRLQRLAEADESTAMAGLLELAPALQHLSRELEREHNPMAAVPRAMLELLRAQLH
ncbi:MAG TPA: hypothetical protein PK177_13315 [Burkholderiaceae bacterium]|nr:hypothetical protein [Burkholderiaceae bacterium]